VKQLINYLILLSATSLVGCSNRYCEDCLGGGGGVRKYALGMSFKEPKAGGSIKKFGIHCCRLMSDFAAADSVPVGIPNVVLQLQARPFILPTHNWAKRSLQQRHLQCPCLNTAETLFSFDMSTLAQYAQMTIMNEVLVIPR
jgi:hypothetical protein